MGRWASTLLLGGEVTDPDTPSIGSLATQLTAEPLKMPKIQFYGVDSRGLDSVSIW